MNKGLKSELSEELTNLLAYWSKYSLDHVNGGFLGERDFYNKEIQNAPKGLILNTRLLWAFAASSNHLKSQTYKPLCDRAYEYLSDHFKDNKHGGVYWLVDYKGVAIIKRKQVYAQAFAIYSLSEYYQFSKVEAAKQWAIDLFLTIEKYAKDNENDGYFEAFDEDWSPIDDMRLSEKDLNASKTMNTHLHVLESYTSLLKIHNSNLLRDALKNLVNLMFNRFLNNQFNFELFFDSKWHLLSDSISFGHDIEAAWLIIEAAKTLNDDSLMHKAEQNAIKISDRFLKTAIDKYGGVMNEKNKSSGHIDTDLHWWPQMEALIGLAFVYRITGNIKYEEVALKIWDFSKKHLKDHNNGEWHFRVNKYHEPYSTESKVSMWKAPYHNTRACIILSR